MTGRSAKGDRGRDLGRGAGGRRLAANPGLHDPRRDWVVLNDAIGDDDSTLAWFDGVKAEPLSRQRHADSDEMQRALAPTPPNVN